MKRNRLLVVDGDPRSLRVLDVSLRSAGFEVETAANGAEAWARIQSATPDLVLADAALEGIDGFELCTRLRATPAGALTPFIFIAADQTLKTRIRGLEAGAEDYLVKPAYVKEVISRVRNRLQQRERDRLDSGTADAPGISTLAPEAAFSGDLADMTAVDLVQLAEAKRRSGIIHLCGEAGTVGAIYIRHGKVVDAEVGQLSGLDALSRLFAWVRGTFTLEWKTIRRKDAIERSPAELIMEGMQRLDDGNRLRQTFPDSRVVFEVDYPLMSARLAEIPDEMNGVLRLCDGARTLEEILLECPLSDVEVLTALIRLQEEGIIFAVHEQPADGEQPAVQEASDAAALDFSEGIGDDAQASPNPSPNPNPNQDPGTAAAKRRRTDPGLGQTPAALSIGATTPPHPSVALSAVAGVIGERPAASSFARAFEVGADDQATGASSKADVSRTQRGFGPGLASDVASSDSAVPLTVTDRRSSGSHEPLGQYLTAAPIGEGLGEAVRTFDLDGSADGSLVPRLLNDRNGSPTVGRKVVTSAATDSTERISYRDDDISDKEARDELGVPSGWRVLRFLAVALVLGGLTYVITHRLVKADGAKTPPTVAAVPQSEHSTAAAQPAEAAPVVAAESPPPSAEASATIFAAPSPTPPVDVEAPPVEPLPVAVAPPTPAAPPVVEPRPTASQQLATCRTAFAKNRMKEALAACAAAAAANPRSAEALTVLAQTELNRGNLSKAGALAQRALAIDPDMADAYVIAGGVHQDSGQNREAKAAYRRYLELAPHGRYADELRSIVHGL